MIFMIIIRHLFNSKSIIFWRWDGFHLRHRIHDIDSTKTASWISKGCPDLSLLKCPTRATRITHTVWVIWYDSFCISVRRHESCHMTCGPFPPFPWTKHDRTSPVTADVTEINSWNISWCRSWAKFSLKTGIWSNMISKWIDKNLIF